MSWELNKKEMPLTELKWFSVMVKQGMKSCCFCRVYDWNRCTWCLVLLSSVIPGQRGILMAFTQPFCHVWAAFFCMPSFIFCSILLIVQFTKMHFCIESGIVQPAASLRWDCIRSTMRQRECITPCETLKHAYYKEAGGCEKCKRHQMDSTTENHHTSSCVPAGHQLTSWVCFFSLVMRRSKKQNKTAA